VKTSEKIVRQCGMTMGRIRRTDGMNVKWGGILFSFDKAKELAGYYLL